MPIWVIILIAVAIMGDRKNKFTRKQFSGLKTIIGILIAISLFTSVIPGLISILFMLSVFLLPVIIPVVIGLLIANDKKKEQNSNQGSYNQRNDKTGSYYQPVSRSSSTNRGMTYQSAPKSSTLENVSRKQTPVQTASSVLPKAASKRRKIIEKFNKKYQLLLTDSQIQRIVDASYYSRDWEYEIYDMSKEYSSIYEWYKGNNSWLRAYLSVFKVQSVSSDFEQQKDICFSEFKQVFDGVDVESCYTTDEAIKKINEKYFTDFNDISFMIAYRFLEACGAEYTLGNKEVVSNDAKLDELLEKYKSTTAEV